MVPRVETAAPPRLAPKASVTDQASVSRVVARCRSCTAEIREVRERLQGPCRDPVGQPDMPGQPAQSPGQALTVEGIRPHLCADSY